MAGLRCRERRSVRRVAKGGVMMKYYDEHVRVFYMRKNADSGLTEWLRAYFKGNF